MARRVVLDVSGYQVDVDFARVKRESPEIVGVIIKATEGQWPGTNPYFEQQYASAVAAGLLTGAYLFDHTSVPSGTEASLYLSKVAGKTWPLGHWLDFEANDAGTPPNVVAQHVLEVLQAISGAYPGHVGIYTAPWAWNPWTGNANFSSFPLWLAGYTPTLPPSPAAWGTPRLWQFTDSYQTYFGACDASVILDDAWPSSTDWFDMATQADLEATLRKVLNEGTAAGQPSWAGTNKALLATLQGVVNTLKAIVGSQTLVIQGGNGHPGLAQVHAAIGTLETAVANVSTGGDTTPLMTAISNLDAKVGGLTLKASA